MIAMHHLAPPFQLPRLSPHLHRCSVFTHSPHSRSTDSPHSVCTDSLICRRIATVSSRSRGHHKLHALQTSTESISDAWETNLADEDVRILAKFKSLFNFVQVLEISRRSLHPLAGCKLLLLDRAGNIQSVYNPYKALSDSYYDVFAALPPLLPPGALGVLGLGAGTAARVVRHFWPAVEVHGWELDASVVMVAREFFDLQELEDGKRIGGGGSAFEEGDEEVSPGSGRLVVHVGDALACQAPTEDGFAGLTVDLFSGGAVVPALQRAETWQRLRTHLKPGGRIMVNCGGLCVEADDKSGKDGEVTMRETLEAIVEVFPGEVFQFRLPGKGSNCVALTGPCPDFQAWEEALPQVLRNCVFGWVPVSSFVSDSFV